MSTIISNGSSEAANGTAAIKVEKICCVGAGYVGGPTAAVIAFQNPHIQVTVVDRDEIRIRRWNSLHPPIYEPGLHDIIRIARDGSREATVGSEPDAEGNVTLATRQPNLFFSTDIAKHIGEADIVLVAVNTPTKYRGVGAGSATDMTAFEAVTGVVAQHAREGAIIVEKSTVPCRTAQLVSDTLSMHRPGVHFEILSNPEFLAAGTAVADLLYPDRILIGSNPTPAGKKAAEALASVYAAWVPRERILTTNVWSSELAKLVANSMLAQRISSINSISALCEQTGADVDEVARAVGVDPRIGNKFLMAGIGFGGSCFKKDVLNLVYLADTMGLPEVAEYWRQVVKMNEYARDRFSNRVIKCLNNTLVGKKVTILGFAFKKNTSDTREAPALEMIKTLLEERPREVAVFDPCCNPLVIKQEIKTLLGPLAEGANISVYGNAYDACESSTAIIIATEFDEFRNQPVPKPAPAPATSDVDCTVPYQSPDENVEEPVDLLNASVQIFLVLEGVVTEIYSRRKVSLQLTEGISLQLRDWSSRWLKQLKDIVANPEAQDRAQASGACQILATYYYAVMLVSRPFLMYELCRRLSDGSLNSNGRSALTSGKSKLADACIDAASLMVDPILDLIQKGILVGHVPILVSWLFASSLVLGVGLLGGFGRVLEKYTRMAIHALDHCSKHDTHAGQYSLIAQSLLTTALEYLEKRELAERQRRTENSSQLFGLIPSDTMDSSPTFTGQSMTTPSSRGRESLDRTFLQHNGLQHVGSPLFGDLDSAFLGLSESMMQTPDPSYWGGPMGNEADSGSALNLFALLDAGGGIDLTHHL